MDKLNKIPKKRSPGKYLIDIESNSKISINWDYKKMLTQTKHESNHQPETIRGIIDRIKTL